MSDDTEMHTGVVVRLTPDGLAIVKDDQKGELHYFTLDELHGYRGEPLKDASVRVGSRIKFVIVPSSSAVANVAVEP